MKNIIYVIVMGCMLVLTGCNSGDNSSDLNNNDKLNIISTTTMIHDLVSTIGGEYVESTCLVGVGVDPHLYKASAGDVSKMENANVIVYNGLHLEGEMGQVFESLESKDKNIICLEDAINEEELLIDEDSIGTAYDPHIWFNVSLWRDSAVYVTECLTKIDEINADKYLDNLEEYIQELNNLEEYIKNRIDEVEEEQRVLITAHDAFNYFGDAYGFEVRGLQGISTDAEASTSDISELANFINDNRIKAIFVESSVSSKNIEALQEAVKAKGFGVEIGGELYSDSLGDANSGHETYIKTFIANIDTIIEALK
ncbi:MAG: zinc ABC transporter substrate-binding protein [bacterium]